MGSGFYRYDTGKFDLVLSIRYNATPAELDEWRASFEQASRLLFDATDGQHQLGNIYVYNDDALITRNEADAYLLFNEAISHATGYEQLGIAGLRIEYGRDERFKPFVITHEFGHYVYGLLDEYIRGGPADPFGEDDTAHCIYHAPGAGAAANACIMEASWDLGDRFGNAGLGGALVDGVVSEFCSQKHPEILGLAYHSHDNLQHNTKAESCWDTMETAGPANQAGVTFDLILPAAVDELPDENTDRAEASPITWIVLGQQQRFMLLLDRSGSMTGNKLNDAKIGAKFWADASITDDRLGVISYSHTLATDYPLQSIDDDADRQAMRDAIDLIVAGGTTAIGDALREGMDQILADIANPNERGRNVIALVTDGKHNTGESPDDVLPDLIDNGVCVYTLGIGTNVNANLLAEIAHRTGGEYFPINPNLGSAAQQAEIRDALILIEGFAHGGGLVADVAGSTNPGVHEEEVFVEPGSQLATFTLSWNNLDDLFYLELLSPDGVSITLNSVPSYARPIRSQNNPYMGFQVTKPVPGIWKLIVWPERVAEVAYYRLFVFSQNPRINGGLVSSPQLCQPGLPLPVQLQCYYDHPVTGLKVNGSVLLPSGERVPLEFSDDGNKEVGDVLPGDGLYSAILRETRKPGMYTIEVEVESDGQSVSYGKVGKPKDNREREGYDPIPPFRRKFTRTVSVGDVPLKDVALTPGRGNPGETLQITLVGQHTHFRRSYTSAQFGEGIEVGEVEVLDKHNAQVTIFIGEMAQPGLRDVIITTNVYGETINVEGGFEVLGSEYK